MDRIGYLVTRVVEGEQISKLVDALVEDYNSGYRVGDRIIHHTTQREGIIKSTHKYSKRDPLYHTVQFPGGGLEVIPAAELSKIPTSLQDPEQQQMMQQP
jgi:hypothetical protein